MSYLAAMYFIGALAVIVIGAIRMHDQMWRDEE
jgi:hypothetical protein